MHFQVLDFKAPGLTSLPDVICLLQSYIKSAAVGRHFFEQDTSVDLLQYNLRRTGYLTSFSLLCTLSLTAQTVMIHSRNCEKTVPCPRLISQTLRPEGKPKSDVFLTALNRHRNISPMVTMAWETYCYFSLKS